MEMGESVAVGGLLKEMKDKCPFKDPAAADGSEETEGPGDDDISEAYPEQDNDGGVLGRNLKSGSLGKAGTISEPLPEGDFQARPESLRVSVAGAPPIEEDVYPVKVAAHHLIPGNAALGQSDLYDFLGPAGSGELTNDGPKRQRKDVKVRKRSYAINGHIGYNINGAHNGAWLPGNYAIRRATEKHKGATPVEGMGWGALEEGFAAWQMNYVAAASVAGKAQFHDTHENYSERVLKLLNKISSALRSHLQGKCSCSSEDKVPPPLMVKIRLYAISQFLRGELRREFKRRRPCWYTSDRWVKEIYQSESSFRRFAAARKAAREQ